MVKDDYKRARKNFLARMNRLKKQGVEIGIDVPAIPKKITQGSINRLNKLTSKEILKKSQYVRKDTGEVVSGRRFRDVRREERKAIMNDNLAEFYVGRAPISPKTVGKPSTPRREVRAVDIIMSNFRQQADRYAHTDISGILNKWLKNMINQYGESNTAMMLENAKNAGKTIDPKDVYREGGLQNKLADFFSYMPDAGSMAKEQYDYMVEEIWDEYE